MAAEDEDALACDFMETYQVPDYRALPLKKAATLAAGLRDDSRIKLKLAGIRVPIETLLLAHAVDGINTLIWMRTKDGKNNRNRPESVTAKLTGRGKEKNVRAFESAEDFEAERGRILRGE